MHEIMIGTSARSNADVSAMRDAGIGWIRQGFSVPFSDRLYGEVTDQYREARGQTEAWLAAGMGILGITPLPGTYVNQPDSEGRMRPSWRSRMPDWFGEPGSAQYLRCYQATCAWLAQDLRGMVTAWQIANELDAPPFAGPLNLRQACDLILAGARGLKAGDPSVFVGPNPNIFPGAYYLYGRLYADPDSPLDYAGTDQYYGSWQPGGPELWAPKIAELHALTDRPVFVNEWGYSSAGEVMTDEEQRLGVANCQLRKWTYSWGPGHSPEGQAEFVRAAFDGFLSQRSALVGLFFYRWDDQERCWACGSPDCPMETRWGLVDLRGRPKPAYYAFTEGVARLVGEQQAGPDATR